MPAGKTPSFKRIDTGDVIALNRRYLVAKDGEYVVGFVNQQTSSSGAAPFRVMPVNHRDGLASFYADRADILAEYSPTA